MDYTEAAQVAQASIDGGYLHEGHGVDPDTLARYLSATADFSKHRRLR